MAYREFHIWDFPEDKVRIFLENNREFLEDCIGKFGSIRKLSEYLNVSYGVVHGWKTYNLFIPLWAFKKIVSKLKLDWYDIEKRIVSYKGLNLSNKITSPRLPVKESPELFAIITHLIADGCISKDGIPMYINSNKKLLNNFVSLLKVTFGDMYVHKKRLKNGVWDYRFPKVIADLISSIYRISFNSSNSCFPFRLFDLPNEAIFSVIRAIVDDEGAIRDNRIVIVMKNKVLILQLMTLVKRIFGQNPIGKLMCRDENYWGFGIRFNYLKKFNDKIKLIHPEKRKNLLYAIRKQRIRRNGNGEPVGKTKFEILKHLKIKNYDVKELSQKLLINAANINSHLKFLSNMNLTKKLEKKKYSYIWTLTNEGLVFLEKCNLEKVKKGLNWNFNDMGGKNYGSCIHSSSLA